MITLEQVLYIVPILALSASITYYAITIRNQNKTRQAQLFMQTFYQDRQDFAHSYSKLRWVYNWNDFDDFWEKYGAETNLDEWEKILSFWGYFESVGILVKDKLLTVDYVDKAIGGFVLFTWQKYRSIVLEARNRWKSPTLLESFEYLYDRIVEYRT
jgi:hypothetical protein